MNTWSLIIGGLWVALLIFQIWRGKTLDALASKYAPSRIVSRKTEPVLFWVSIAVQVFILAVVLLVIYFLV